MRGRSRGKPHDTTLIAKKLQHLLISLTCRASLSLLLDSLSVTKQSATNAEMTWRKDNNSTTTSVKKARPVNDSIPHSHQTSFRIANAKSHRGKIHILNYIALSHVRYLRATSRLSMLVPVYVHTDSRRNNHEYKTNVDMRYRDDANTIHRNKIDILTHAV